MSSTMFFTVTERHATSYSTSKTSSCFDLSLTDVDSASSDMTVAVFGFLRARGR